MTRHLDRRLKLRHLKVAYAVSTHQSLMKAAQALCVTQPSLTRCLQELEDILGVRLFDRHAKGVTETRFGQVFAGAARRVLEELQHAGDEIDRMKAKASSSLVVGVLPVAAVGLLPGVLAKLNSVNVELQIRLVQGRTEDLLPLLSSGGLDLVVGRLYPPEIEDGLVREALYEEPISILARAGHPIFAEPASAISNFDRYKLVLPTTSQRLGGEIDELLSMLDLDTAPRLRSSSNDLIRELVQSSDYITVMPRMMMSGELARGSVRALPLPIAAPSRPAGVIYRCTSELSPGSKALIAAVRHYVRDVAANPAIAA